MTDETNQEQAIFSKNIVFENSFLLKIQEEATSSYEVVVFNAISQFLTHTFEAEYFINYKPFSFTISKENQNEVYGLQFALETMLEKGIIMLEHEDETVSNYSITIASNKENKKKAFSSHDELMNFLATATIWSPEKKDDIVQEENIENIEESVIADPADTQETTVE